MSSNADLEVQHVGGELMLKLARQEFLNGFEIIARTPDYIVLGDQEKNVSFSRGKKLRVLDRHNFGKTNNISRK